MWGAWTKCNVSCGAGVISRSRTCYNGVAGIDCVGDEYEQAECYARAYDGGRGRDFFSQWSPCSTTCGTGQQTRTISNTCTDEVGYVRNFSQLIESMFQGF